MTGIVAWLGLWSINIVILEKFIGKKYYNTKQYGQIFTVVTWNVSTHAPPEASVNVDGPSVWKVSKSNLKAQISKKEKKMSMFPNM